MKKSILITSLLFVGSALVAVPSAFAGGCAPGQPCYEQYQTKKRMKDKAAMAEKTMEKHAMKKEKAAMMDKDSDYSLNLSTGVNVLYFDCQDATVAGGVYADVRKADLPVNFRVGVEVSHLNATEHAFTPSSSFAGEEPDFTFVRIPFAVEYVAPVAEDTELFLGGGPDIIHVSGNGADGNVGGHLEARIVKEIGENLNASFSTGYLWSSADVGTERLGLNSAYTGAAIGYRF